MPSSNTIEMTRWKCSISWYLLYSSSYTGHVKPYYCTYSSPQHLSIIISMWVQSCLAGSGTCGCICHITNFLKTQWHKTEFIYSCSQVREVAGMGCVMWIHLGTQGKFFSWKWQENKRASRNLVLKVDAQNSPSITFIHILLATVCLLTKPKVKGWGSTLCQHAKKKTMKLHGKNMVQGGVNWDPKFDLP